MSNQSGTGALLLIPLLGLGISTIVHWAVTTRKKVTMIQKYHNSVTESAANGKSNFLVFAAMVMVFLVSIGTSIARTVSSDRTCLFITILVIAALHES